MDSIFIGRQSSYDCLIYVFAELDSARSARRFLLTRSRACRVPCCSILCMHCVRTYTSCPINPIPCVTMAMNRGENTDACDSTRGNGRCDVGRTDRNGHRKAYIRRLVIETPASIVYSAVDDIYVVCQMATTASWTPWKLYTWPLLHRPRSFIESRVMQQLTSEQSPWRPMRERLYL